MSDDFHLPDTLPPTPPVDPKPPEPPKAAPSTGVEFALLAKPVPGDDALLPNFPALPPALPGGDTTAKIVDFLARAGLEKH